MHYFFCYILGIHLDAYDIINISYKETVVTKYVNYLESWFYFVSFQSLYGSYNLLRQDTKVVFVILSLTLIIWK